MPLVCPRCQRANPGEAVYCYFDGIVLRQGFGPAAPGATQLPQEFVFPSGRRCRSYDDLVQGCQYDWEDARDLLARGAFDGYLTGIGRLDLARAAREARAEPDPDVALHNFVRALPVTQAQGPRLDLHPRRIEVGPLPAGSQRELTLAVTNQGKGLLQGKLTVQDGGRWLRLRGDDPAHQPLKAAREQAVSLRLDARGLAPAGYHARLTVITNGGVAEVPVRLDVTASPFPAVPFHGAASPRELAERMRGNPRPAVPLLENGEVARWFAANGWAYPVDGAAARGVAAVQQFFEGMGLSKPPDVRLSAAEVTLRCTPPAAAAGQVVLSTEARKWVYAAADSDAAWLRVTTPSVSGPRQASVAFEAVTSVLEPGRTHEATVRVVANAGQKLAVRVRVEVARPAEPPARRALRPALAGLILGAAYRLLLALPADVAARTLVDGPALGAGAGPALADPAALRTFVLLTWWIGAVACVAGVWKRGGSAADLLCGAVAGSAAGVAGAATVGCLLDAGDALVHAALGVGDVPLPLWLAVATAGWGVFGAAAGLGLAALGPGGRNALAAAAAPLAWLARVCGLTPLADLLRRPS